MLVDSHCHLNFLDLAEFDGGLDEVIAQAKEKGVHQFLSVCVELADYPRLKEIAEVYPEVYISVGVHPSNPMDRPLLAEELVELAAHPSCIAFGETGLDYYHCDSTAGIEEQQQRFRQHIQAALQASKPLIIHTRQAAEDTLKILREEGAEGIGGVMHCFTENWEVAQQAMDLNFYISMSGIVSFKNALSLQEVAKKLPLDRMLIETDAPYLAPVPYRGKQNHPALVYYVAKAVAELKNISLEEVAAATSRNFYQCFRINQKG